MSTSGIRLFGTNGEVIEDNQVVVVWDRIAKCYRFVGNDGSAYLVNPEKYPNIKMHDILTVDKKILTPFTGV